MRRGAVLAGGLALAAAGGGLVDAARADLAQRTSVKPAAQAFAFLKDYYKLPAVERSRFALAYRLQEKGQTTPARLTLVDGGTETPLAASPDGWLTRLPSAAALERGAQVRTEVPAGSKPGMAMIPEALLRAGPDARIGIDTADLQAASAQVAAVTRKMAGPLSFVAPKFTRVLFSGAEGAAAVDAEGRATPLPLWRGTPVLDLTAAGAVKSVRFTRAPYHALLAPPAKAGS